MREILLDIHVEALPEGGFLATSTELPGLVAQGRTLAETLEIAQDVARKLVESYVEHGDELPAALRSTVSAGGDVRIPVSV
jgi:antitoxin HicB